MAKKESREKGQGELYGELKGSYAEGMEEIKSATKRFDRVRKYPERAIKEAAKMNYGSMKVLTSITLSACSFPGDYIKEIGEKALETFKEAYRKAPGHRVLRGNYYSYKSNTKVRIERLEDLMYNWWPKNKERMRDSLQRLAPESLRLAGRIKAEDFATA